MIIESKKYLIKKEIISDVIIVGSGLAALAVAYTLEKRGIGCILFESGTESEHAQWRITSEPITKADYGVQESYAQLHVRREPGGGSSVWGGWCTSLRSLNFSRTDLTGYPAWPLRKQDILPFYRKAGEWLQVDGAEGALMDEVFELPEKHLAVKQFGFSPPTRYSTHLREHVSRSEKITLITGATIHSLHGKDTKVTSLTLHGANKKTIIHCTGNVVLAGGAVGNSRILARSAMELNIAPETQSFIGNYLFEHPHCYSMGRVAFIPDTEALISKKQYWSRDFISLIPTDGYLTRNGLSDFNFQLTKIPASELTKAELAIANNYQFIHGGKPQFYQCTLGMEQVAVVGNGVLDSEAMQGKSDGHLRLGLESQKPVVLAAKNWLFSQGVHAWSEPESAVPVQAVGHLQGTTRMGAASDAGVVDRNCRVFGLKNLYVVGSSVFPTGGFANPTLTIVALAIRLGEHVSEAKP